jgi:hypothetical protein
MLRIKPVGADERLDELGFGGSFGLVFEERLSVALISGLVFGGQDDRLAGPAVAQRVGLGALFSDIGSGAGGFLRIGFVGDS